MSMIKDNAFVKTLSIPGSHNSGAFQGYGGDIFQCQSMSVKDQLNIGIRALDFKLKHEGHFSLNFYTHWFYEHLRLLSVNEDITDFLDENPSEGIIINVFEERGFSNVFGNLFLTTFDNMRYRGDYLYKGNMSDPKMKDLRGKILIIDEKKNKFNSLNSTDWRRWKLPNGRIQDARKLDTNWNLYSKWKKVKNMLNIAAEDKTSTSGYMNFLSGEGGSFPYFVASGHSSHFTGSPRLSTGRTTPTWSSYPDFPRTDCAPILPCKWKCLLSIICGFTDMCDVCTISFEGTNVMTMNYIREWRNKRLGIVFADFPGKGLVNSIINVQLNKNVKKVGWRYVELIAKHSGKCLDVAGSSTSKGANVHQYSCHGGDNQRFNIFKRMNGYYFIKAIHSKKCFDVKDFSKKNGATVQQWRCHYKNNQLWKIVHRGGGYYTFKNVNSGKYLDISGRTLSNMGNLQQYSYHGGENQLFKIQD